MALLAPARTGLDLTKPPNRLTSTRLGCGLGVLAVVVVVVVVPVLAVAPEVVADLWPTEPLAGVSPAVGSEVFVASTLLTDLMPTATGVVPPSSGVVGVDAAEFCGVDPCAVGF